MFTQIGHIIIGGHFICFDVNKEHFEVRIVREMDSFLENEDNIRSVDTRWDRIEKRHINSAIVYDRSDEAKEICKNLIENKEFITENHFKAFLGEKPKRLCLDPNLVMDLRHSQVSFKFDHFPSSFVNTKNLLSSQNDAIKVQQ